jgi:hypothetical protein
VQSWTHEASRHVVALALRRRVSTIVYDDSIRSFVRSYPWQELRLQIQLKADSAGLAFVHVEGVGAIDSAEPNEHDSTASEAANEIAQSKRV